MPSPQRNEFNISLKFGGGQNSSASEDQINELEGTLVENVILDPNNRNLKTRPPFDLVDTATNGAQINGFATLVKRDGTTTLLIQAGTKVYNYSAATGFVEVGTVDSGARLRGQLYHYWSLDDLVIITDLALADVVMTWNGTTLADMSHNLGGDFKAKYCLVEDERARYGNVVSGTATPHMVVTSKLSDFTNLSVSNKPSSALGAGDPFFVLTPDQRNVVGMAASFGVIAVSSEFGSIYQIRGTDSNDTSIDKLFPRSFASGLESLSFVGNDIQYGRPGRIESMSSTEKYGDVEIDDLSLPISDELESLKDWDIAYNSRTQKVYFHSSGQEFIWVYNKSLEGLGLSPWVKYTTQHSMAMNPTAMMSIIDPDDGLEYIFMGDASGNVYRIEGTGTNGDGGTNNIKQTWRSRLFKLPDEFSGHSFRGFIDYRSDTTETVKLKFLFAGSYVTNEDHTISLPGTAGGSFWNGSVFWGGSGFWNVPFTGRFRREAFTPSGSSEAFQIEIEYEGTGTVEINEIGLSFPASN